MFSVSWFLPEDEDGCARFFDTRPDALAFASTLPALAVTNIEGLPD